VIIDNMMNLELLFWATRHSGDSSFYKIAVTHANTTLKNHYRPDHSSWHVVDYDPATGNVNVKQTAQGFADYSAWARGQAWGLYGWVVMYRATKNPVYLAQANAVAKFILNHPNLPADKVPYWDYNSIDIPATYRDASAASHCSFSIDRTEPVCRC
jgi:unsaturated chondroitin disaccharide hydrolase